MNRRYWIILAIFALIVAGGLGYVVWSESGHATAPISASEKSRIDGWLRQSGLNEYGDAPDTLYAGGTPLFVEVSQKLLDRYEYLEKKFPAKPWDKK